MDLQGDEGTERSRAGAPVITPPFEAVWPDVERRLRAMLYRRRLDPASADDVVQEVALRVLSNDVTFESSTDLLRWAAPVACRLHVDLLRHRARMTDPSEAAEHPARDDVAGEVADRLELQRALRAIAALRPADRDAIIDAVASEPAVPRDRQEAVRLAVRRHRARSRLAVALGQLAAWIGTTVIGWRMVARERLAPVVAMLPAAAAIPIAVSLGVGTSPAPAPRPPGVAAPAARPPVIATQVTRTVSVPRVAVPAPSASRQTDTAVLVRDNDDDVDAPAPYQTYAMDGPGPVDFEAGGDHRREDDRTVCVSDSPWLNRLCV